MIKSYNSLKLYSYWFLLPAGLVFAVFFVIPTLASFVLAFTNWNSYQGDVFSSAFIGFDNFVKIFSDRSLSIAFKNTFLFAILTTVLKCVLGLLLALLVNAKLKTAGYLQTMFFAPSILNSVAIGLIFLAMYNPSYGLVNEVLGFIGLDFLQNDWLGNLDLVMYSVIMVEVWKWTGYNMVIFLAGLKAIPEVYYEAAMIDGCGRWQRFRYVTLPLLQGSLNINLILGVISGLKVFEIVYAITGGGPGFATETFNSVIYKKFAEGYFGLSTAAGMLLFLIIAVIAFALNSYLMRKEVEV